jgi:hypothetical protein
MPLSVSTAVTRNVKARLAQKCCGRGDRAPVTLFLMERTLNAASREPKIMFTLRVAATLAMLGFLGLHGTLWSAVDEKGETPAKRAEKNTTDEKTIRALIDQLSDDAFEKREAAHKRLAHVGGPALALLKKASKESTDAEVRERATDLIERIQESGLHLVRVDFYHDFRKGGFRKDKFRHNGPNAATWIKSEAQGLRITIPADKAATSSASGMATAFTIKGDFEVTVGYQLLSTAPPPTGYGAGLEVFLMTDTRTHEAIAFDRRILPGGGDVYACSRNTTDAQGQRQFAGQGDKPAKGKTGRIRIIRIGSRAIYAVQDELSKDFREIYRVDFGPEDLAMLRFAANPGRGMVTVDVCIQDLRIRCAEADALKPIVAADKASP